MTTHQPLVKCPACNGEGMVHTNVTRNEWGVWESDENECIVCEGKGEVTFFVLDEYNEWLTERECY